MSENQHIFLKKAEVLLIEPGIVENILGAYETIDASDVLELKKTNRLINNDKAYAVLISGKIFSSITNEASKVAASDKHIGFSVANAVLVNNTGHRLLGNFYLKVHNPAIKTKLFTDRNEAINWLRKQLNASQQNNF